MQHIISAVQVWLEGHTKLKTAPHYINLPVGLAVSGLVDSTFYGSAWFGQVKQLDESYRHKHVLLLCHVGP